MAAISAQRTAGPDVKRSLRIAAVEVAIGGKAAERDERDPIRRLAMLARFPGRSSLILAHQARSQLRQRRGWRRGGGRRSLFRDPGLTQAVNDALVSRDRRGVVISPRAGPEPGDGESRVECRSRLSLGPRLNKAPETRQSSRQIEMTAWKAPIGLDEAAQPGDCLLLPSKAKLGRPGNETPKVCVRVAGTEAQRLLDVSLGVFGLAELNLAVANCCVRDCQVSIQRQRPLALPDALSRAVGEGLDSAQGQVGHCSLWSQGQRLDCGGLSGGKPRGAIVNKETQRGPSLRLASVLN